MYMCVCGGGGGGGWRGGGDCDCVYVCMLRLLTIQSSYQFKSYQLFKKV